MKKQLKTILTALLMAAVLLFAFGCGDTSTSPSTSASPSASAEAGLTCTVVVLSDMGAGAASAAFSITTEEDYLLGLLTELDAQEETFSYTYSESSYGAYLTGMTGGSVVLAPGASSYVAILINSTDINYIDVSSYAINLNFAEKSFTSAGLGVSSMPVIDGMSYLFVLATY